MSGRGFQRGKRGVVAIVAAVAALGAAVSVGATARADTPPSAWDRAKQPALGDAYQLHAEAVLFVQMVRNSSPDEGRRKEFYARLGPRFRLRLERGGAETSAYLPLRIDLADLYYELGNPLEPALWRKANAIAQGVLALANSSAEPGLLAHANTVAAFACARLADTDCERAAYTALLRLRDNDGDRLIPALNLAESEMRAGNIKASIEGYRECLRMTARVSPNMVGETQALATWGLAVALDRAGDRPGAEREALLALEREKPFVGAVSLLRSPGVFFVPTYEVFYYEGLGFAARARTASTGRASEKLWAQAERAFATFVEAAERDKDRWLEHGKARLLHAKVEHEKAKRRAAKEPAEREDGAEVTF